MKTEHHLLKLTCNVTYYYIYKKSVLQHNVYYLIQNKTKQKAAGNIISVLGCQCHNYNITWEEINNGEQYNQFNTVMCPPREFGARQFD